MTQYDSRAATCRTDHASHPLKTLGPWESPGVVSFISRCFANDEFLLPFFFVFLSFFPSLSLHLCSRYDDVSFQADSIVEYQVSLLLLSKKTYLTSLSIVVSATITSQCDTIYKRARGRGNEINFLRDRFFLFFSFFFFLDRTASLKRSGATRARPA